MTKSEFSAYLAGVIDSDGSLSICHRHKTRPTANFSPLFQLTWSNTDRAREFLDVLVKTYGGSYCLVTPSSKSNYPNTKDVLHYHLSTNKILPMILDVLPYLRLKRRQAINIIRLRRVSRRYNPSNPKPIRIYNFEYKLYQYNKRLNTKNKGTVCA